MTTVPLRAYNREIEEAIDQKQIEEAIAHCLHILKIFPKHVDTYRFLGKAYLESQRYGNAADIFQRVLSSIPDDFISHVGMSIIREDESNLDAAIWHMERAFESQSYNTAIQGELRRLYGLRDGMEPPKIRMTRGALARMYAKSDLYEQAIAEIRSNLAVDSQRTDLQVLLAKMYAKNGQNAKAIEVCGSLVQHLPFCLEANRLLADLIPRSEHQEGIEIYQQRIQALDPYEAFVSPISPVSGDVPDQAVTIARLEWDGGPVVPETADQPEWATSIGVSLEEPGSQDEAEELPEWLTDSPDEDQELEVFMEEVRGGDTIPDWMQDAGWETASGDIDESKLSITMDEEEPEVTLGVGEAEVGDIPEWLQEIAPAGTAEVQLGEIEDVASETIGEDLPDWLSEEANGATDTIITWLDEKDKSEETLVEDEPGIGSEVIHPEIEEDVSGDPTLVEPPLESLETGEEIPDWLHGVVDATTKSEEIQEIQSDEILEIEKELETADAEILDEIPDTTAVSETTEVPEWLQDLGGDVTIEEEKSGVTDWLKKIEEDISEQESISEDSLEPIPEGDLLSEAEPEIETMESADELIIDSDELEVIPDWLQSLKDEQQELENGTEPSEEFIEGAIEDEDIPSWLESLKEETEELDVERETGKAFISGEITPEIVESDSVEIPEWLQNFEAGIPDQDEVLEPSAEHDSKALSEEPGVEELDDIPEWLNAFEDTQPEPPTSGDPSTEEEPDELVEIGEGEIPEWLDEFEDKIGETVLETETTVSTPTDEVIDESAEIPIDGPPDWLKSLEDEALEPQTEPTMVVPSEVPFDETFDTEPVDTPEILAAVDEETGVEIGDPPISPFEIIDGKTEDDVEPEPGDIPDWLGKLDDEAVITEFEPEPTVIAAPEDQVEEAIEIEPSELPDWLQGLRDDAEELVIEPESISALPGEEPATEVDEPEEGEIPDWLEGFMEEPPVSELDTQPTAIVSPVEIREEMEETVLSADDVTPDIPEITPDAEPLDIPEWLLDLVDEEPVPSTEVETPEIIADEEPADIPEWLSSPLDESPDIPEPIVPEDEVLEGKIELEVSGEVEEVALEGESSSEIEFEDADAAMAWLETLALGGDISDEALLTGTDELSQEIAESIDEEVEKVIDDSDVEIPIAEPEIVESVSRPELTEELEIPKDLETTPELDDIDLVPEIIVSGEFETIDEDALQEAEISDDIIGEPDEDFGFEDADDAIAWLEGLAAKQGVSEDELISRPEDRSETPPEWVQQEVIEEIHEEPEVPGEPATQFEETTPVVEIPDWLQDAIESEELGDQVTPESDLEALQDTDGVKISAELPEFLIEALGTDIEDEILFSDDDITSYETAGKDSPWLEITEAEDIEPILMEVEIEGEPEVDEVDVVEPIEKVTEAVIATDDDQAISDDEMEDVPTEILPDDLEQLDESYEWLPADTEDMEAESKVQLELNEASLNQLERLLSLGFQGAQAIIVYREENGPFEQLDDLLKVPGITEEIIEAIRPEVTITPISPEISKVTTGVFDQVSEVEPVDKYHAIQLDAASDITQGNTNVGIKKYSGLIKKGQRLKEVIQDLNKVLSRDIPNEVCVDVLQLLGDAYLKDDSLQEALDAYTKAEELLR
jgi:competence ComEA-like helix-hairpin-helix protein